MVQYSFESHPQTTSSAQLWESFIMSQLYWVKIGNANKMITAFEGETPKFASFNFVNTLLSLVFVPSVGGFMFQSFAKT